MKVADPEILKRGGGALQVNFVGWTGGEQRKLRKYDALSVLILILISTLTTKTVGMFEGASKQSLDPKNSTARPRHWYI